jgi:hypothetical protein
MMPTSIEIERTVNDEFAKVRSTTKNSRAWVIKISSFIVVVVLVGITTTFFQNETKISIPEVRSQSAAGGNVFQQSDNNGGDGSSVDRSYITTATNGVTQTTADLLRGVSSTGSGSGLGSQHVVVTKDMFVDPGPMPLPPPPDNTPVGPQYLVTTRFSDASCAQLTAITAVAVNTCFQTDLPRNTKAPSLAPSAEPTLAPTVRPSAAPSVSLSPSVAPSVRQVSAAAVAVGPVGATERGVHGAGRALGERETQAEGESEGENEGESETEGAGYSSWDPSPRRLQATTAALTAAPTVAPLPLNLTDSCSPLLGYCGPAAVCAAVTTTKPGCVFSSATRDYPAVVRGLACKTCTAASDPRCLAANLRGVIRGGGIKAAYCNDQWLVRTLPYPCLHSPTPAYLLHTTCIPLAYPCVFLSSSIRRVVTTY